jgi:hypothetical protein
VNKLFKKLAIVYPVVDNEILSMFNPIATYARKMASGAVSRVVIST